MNTTTAGGSGSDGQSRVLFKSLKVNQFDDLEKLKEEYGNHYVCLNCGSLHISTSAQPITSHINRHFQIFVCNGCGRRIKNLSSMSIHWKNVHKVNQCLHSVHYNVQISEVDEKYTNRNVIKVKDLVALPSGEDTLRHLQALQGDALLCIVSPGDDYNGLEIEIDDDETNRN